MANCGYQQGIHGAQRKIHIHDPQEQQMQLNQLQLQHAYAMQMLPGSLCETRIESRMGPCSLLPRSQEEDMELAIRLAEFEASNGGTTNYALEAARRAIFQSDCDGLSEQSAYHGVSASFTQPSLESGTVSLINSFAHQGYNYRNIGAGFRREQYAERHFFSDMQPGFLTSENDITSFASRAVGGSLSDPSSASACALFDEDGRQTAGISHQNWALQAAAEALAEGAHSSLQATSSQQRSNRSASFALASAAAAEAAGFLLQAPSKRVEKRHRSAGGAVAAAAAAAGLVLQDQTMHQTKSAACARRSARSLSRSRASLPADKVDEDFRSGNTSSVMLEVPTPRRLVNSSDGRRHTDQRRPSTSTSVWDSLRADLEGLSSVASTQHVADGSRTQDEADCQLRSIQGLQSVPRSETGSETPEQVGSSGISRRRPLAQGATSLSVQSRRIAAPPRLPVI
eukprot:TRINITY_DN9633_c0_g1_i3.p1 TRINITY_DN9633_c0_g1~~TRINITY_DN9633_c0_g1_i3.p1  ORF type:complete len:456 (-),score=79.22 TRINITY_DN9633_c0_g1_i3:207-1574(-)